MLFRSLGYTCVLTLWALIFAMVIGLIFALCNVSHCKPLNILGSIYVDAIRGVPLIVLAYFIYFGVPQAFRFAGINNFRLPALQAGTIALALNCGAYMAEIFRAGIESIDKGQMEASRALGLNYKTSMFKVVIPQAIKNIIPSIGNEFIALIKETSIVSFISIVDLYSALQKIGDPNYDYMVPYLAMALVYVIVIVIISAVIKLIEKRFAKSERK